MKHLEPHVLSWEITTYASLEACSLSEETPAWQLKTKLRNSHKSPRACMLVSEETGRFGRIQWFIWAATSGIRIGHIFFSIGWPPAEQSLLFYLNKGCGLCCAECDVTGTLGRGEGHSRGFLWLGCTIVDGAINWGVLGSHLASAVSLQNSLRKVSLNFSFATVIAHVAVLSQVWLLLSYQLWVAGEGPDWACFLHANCVLPLNFLNYFPNAASIGIVEITDKHCY